MVNCSGCGRPTNPNVSISAWGRSYCSTNCFNRVMGQVNQRVITQVGPVGYHAGRSPLQIPAAKPGCSSCGKAR